MNEEKFRIQLENLSAEYDSIEIVCDDYLGTIFSVECEAYNAYGGTLELESMDEDDSGKIGTYWTMEELATELWDRLEVLDDEWSFLW